MWLLPLFWILKLPFAKYPPLKAVWRCFFLYICHVVSQNMIWAKYDLFSLPFARLLLP